jgi:hypothetical protein
MGELASRSGFRVIGTQPAFKYLSYDFISGFDRTPFRSTMLRLRTVLPKALRQHMWSLPNGMLVIARPD